MQNTKQGLNNPPEPGSCLIKALCSPAAYGHEVTTVRLIETHISWVFLTGQYAYKLKKPVNFGFVDFSNLAKRQFFCAEELRLNRRLSGDLYLGVVPLTGTSEVPKFGGAGAAIDYAVKMRQFPEGQLLSEYAQRGELSSECIDQLAGLIANFHKTVGTADMASAYGNNQDIQDWCDQNFQQITPLVDGAYQQHLQSIQTWSNAQALANSGLMQQRKQQGYIRECHGDLHLGNIALIDGQLMPFDCIEFNPLLRWIDVISEVAFLMMDLIHCGYPAYAFRFLNRYLQYTGDYRGLGLLPYYLVYRVMVRAKVSLLQDRCADAMAHQQALAAFSGYLDLAKQLTKKVKPKLIISHGYSGSGKTRYARQLAESLKAVQISSDIERKRLFGYGLLDNSDSALHSGLYSPEASLQTYRQLADLAKTVIGAGFSVIIDAAFLKHWQREIFQAAAAEWGVEFIILDFQASDAQLASRIVQRKNDASEATLAVLRQQQQSAEPLSEGERMYTLSINTEADNALAGLLDYFSAGQGLKLPG